MDTSNALSSFEKRLWDAADNMRANSDLKSNEYSAPVLGLVFLSYADHRFQAKAAEIGLDVHPDEFRAEGILYLPEGARYSDLLDLPENEDMGEAVNRAMTAIEEANPELTGALPKVYKGLSNTLLINLLRSFSFAEMKSEFQGDFFGRVFEYFLGQFAKTEG